MRTRSIPTSARPFRQALILLSAGVGVALLVVCAGGCGRGNEEAGAQAQASALDSASPVSTITVTRQSITEELEFTGTCAAYEEVDVNPEVGGKVIQTLVDVGDRVERGDALIRLDTSLVSKRRIQAERGVDSAGAQLNQAVKTSELTDRQTTIGIRQAEQGVAAARELLRKAEEGYKLTKENVESRIAQAEVGLASAQSQQRDVFAGARNQEIAQAEAQVRQAEADLSLKKTNYDRYKTLYSQGAVPEATLDQYRTQYEVAQQTVSQARDSLSLAREGARSEQKRMAELGVQQAQAQLDLAEVGRREIEIAARDIESARVGLRQAQEQLRLAEASRRRYDVSLAGVKAARAGVAQAAANSDYMRTTEAKYKVVAPISGIVSARYVDIGEGAGSNDPVLRIVNNDPIRMKCEVSELDVARLNVGMDGTVTIDGLPGMEFFGRITDISPQSRQGQRTYIARVEIDNADGLIKAGMFARIRMVLSEKPDAIVVTRDALVERDGQYTAYVVDDGTVKIRKVKIGLTNSRQMEIVEGVKARDVLVVGGQTRLAEGQKVKPVPVKQPKAPATRARAPRPAEPRPSEKPSDRASEPPDAKDEAKKPAAVQGPPRAPAGESRRPSSGAGRRGRPTR